MVPSVDQIIIGELSGEDELSGGVGMLKEALAGGLTGAS